MDNLVIAELIIKPMGQIYYNPKQPEIYGSLEKLVKSSKIRNRKWKSGYQFRIHTICTNVLERNSREVLVL